MKIDKSKKYVMKILKRHPVEKDKIIVEITEWLEKNVDDDFFGEDSEKKDSEYISDPEEYDEPI